MRILRSLGNRGYSFLKIRGISLLFKNGNHSEANTTKDIRRIFSGIQPTGEMHLGNYLGAIRNWVALQSESDAEILYSIVDLHSITVPQEPKDLRQSIKNMAITLLACGVDPNRCTIFQQSQVPHHAELTWILSCFTPMGILNRMHQWKSKSQTSKEQVCLGLYSYPVLMAADILLYRATHVPIGDDQLQHLELSREIARIFNNAYGDVFSPPKPILGKVTRVMSLRDAKKKMSKSDPNHLSRINLSDSPDTINSKIKKSITDSHNHISYDAEARPEVSNLIDIYCAFSGETPDVVCSKYEDVERFKAVFKHDLTELLVDKLSPIRREIERLRNEDLFVESVLVKGSKTAREIAFSTLANIKKRVGFC